MTEKKKTPDFDLALGIWRMRNGHTVEIRERKAVSYKEHPGREFILWTGWCEAFQMSITWIGAGRGRYCSTHWHYYDIVELIALNEGGRAAA